MLNYEEVVLREREGGGQFSIAIMTYLSVRKWWKRLCNKKKEEVVGN